MQQDQYRTISKFYDAVIEPTTAPLRRIGLSLYPPRRGMRVLDVGCGTGTHLALYAAEGCHIHGLDVSPSMITRARSRLGREADLHIADATEMPFDDNTFDLLIASMFLHELTPTIRSEVTNEMTRVVKPSGRLLVIDFATGQRSVKGHLARGISSLVERAAGKLHYQNSRQFIKTGGTSGLFSEHPLAMELQRTVSGGNLGLYLLKPAQ